MTPPPQKKFIRFINFLKSIKENDPVRLNI